MTVVLSFCISDQFLLSQPGDQDLQDVPFSGNTVEYTDPDGREEFRIASRSLPHNLPPVCSVSCPFQFLRSMFLEMLILPIFCFM